MLFFPFLSLLTCPLYCSSPKEYGREVPEMSSVFFYFDVHSTTIELFFTLTHILVEIHNGPCIPKRMDRIEGT
jgi:hypothetical protein